MSVSELIEVLMQLPPDMKVGRCEMERRVNTLYETRLDGSAAEVSQEPMGPWMLEIEIDLTLPIAIAKAA